MIKLPLLIGKRKGTTSLNLLIVMAAFNKDKCVWYNDHVSYVALVYNQEMSFQAVCRVKFPGSRGEEDDKGLLLSTWEPKILCILRGFEVAKDCDRTVNCGL